MRAGYSVLHGNGTSSLGRSQQSKLRGRGQNCSLGMEELRGYLVDERGDDVCPNFAHEVSSILGG